MSKTIIFLVLAIGVAQLFGEAPAPERSDAEARLAWFLGDEEQGRIIQGLIDQLDSDSFPEREAATRKLSALPALPASVRRLASTDDRIEVRTRLQRITKLHPVEKETAELNAILKQIADRDLDGTFEKLARIVAAEVWDPDRAVLARAACATITEDDLPLLGESIGSESASVRLLAAAAFSGLDAGLSSAPLRRLLADADEAIVLLAAEALARRSDPESLAAFARLLDSPDFSTRHRSWPALKGLSDQSFAFDPSAEEEGRRAAALRWREWSRGPEARIVGQLPESSAIVLFNGLDLKGLDRLRKREGSRGANDLGYRRWEPRLGGPGVRRHPHQCGF